MLRIRARFWLVHSSFSHDSATTYWPARHAPDTRRSRIQATGFTTRPTPRIVAASTEASAAYTRMWPTVCSARSVARDPTRNPK